MKMILNPNEKVVNAIKKRLIITNGQCPCLPEIEWNNDTRCPCKKMREEDKCCCQLFIKLEE
jgi:ferredoxin-thioredoxin reductase catalytic subunit